MTEDVRELICAEGRALWMAGQEVGDADRPHATAAHHDITIRLGAHVLDCAQCRAVLGLEDFAAWFHGWQADPRTGG